MKKYGSWTELNALVLRANTSGNTGTIDVPDTLGQNTAYTYPDPGGATGTVALLEGSQTYTGAKIFANFKLDTAGAGNLTLAAASLAADQTLTFEVNAGSRQVNLAGDLTLSNDLSTSGGHTLTFTTGGATNVTLPASGTLATLGGNETFGGVKSFNNTVNMLAQNALRFQDAAGGEYVGLAAPATVGVSYNLVLPTAQGGSSQFLQNDGSGNLTWASAAAATAGTSGEIVYKDGSGAFADASGMSWNSGTSLFTVNGVTVTSGGAVTATSFSGNGAGLTSLTGANVTGTVANATNAAAADTVDIADNSTNAAFRVVFTSTNGAGQAVYTDTGLTYNPSTNALTAGSFSGVGTSLTALNATNITSGTIGDAYLPATISSNITGNAATATILQTTRTINSVNFNGSANIVVEPYVEDDETTNATRYLTFVDNSTAGYKRLNEDSSLSYNPSTNTLTCPTFSGSLSGNATTVTNGVYTNTTQTITGAKTFSAATTFNSTTTVNGTLQTALIQRPSAGNLVLAVASGAGLDIRSVDGALISSYLAGFGTIACGLDNTGRLTAGVSDARLKKDIAPWTSKGLAEILNISPISFRWQEQGNDDRVYYGFSAQQVHAAGLPEAFPYVEAKDVYVIDHMPMLAALVNAIKELKAEFDAYVATHP